MSFRYLLFIKLWINDVKNYTDSLVMILKYLWIENVKLIENYFFRNMIIVGNLFWINKAEMFITPRRLVTLGVKVMMTCWAGIKAEANARILFSHESAKRSFSN